MANCPDTVRGSFVAAGTTADAIQQIRCARARGMTETTTTAKVISGRMHREQARSCRGPCRDLEVLLAVASMRPLFTIAAESLTSP